MKKFSIFCLTALLLFATAAMAKQTELRFRAAGKERIQVVLDGKLINRVPAEEIYIKERPGLHKVAVRVYNRRGRLKLEHFEQLHIRPHSKNDFVLESDPYKGSRLLKLVYDNRPERPVLRSHKKAVPAYRPRITTINDEEFFRLKDAINFQPSDEARLQVAMEGLREQQLYAKDVEELLYLFRFESSRLAFAKWAFGRVKDSENYEEVYKAFRYKASIVELEHYLR